MMPDDIPRIDFDSDAFEAGRGAFCKTFREAGPIVKVRGLIWLTRREDIHAVLRNPNVFSSYRNPFNTPFGARFVPMIPTSASGADHARYRRILQPLFSPHGLRVLLPELERQAGALIDAIAVQGHCEA